MRTSKISFAFITVLFFVFCSTTALAEEPDAPGYLGVRLTPVPEMLRVHLGLDEGAGQLVINIINASPADKAGLARYDVITAIDKHEVRDYDEFVEEIQSAGAGAKVTLTFISGGKKQTAKVRLDEAPSGEPDWKYKNTPLGITLPDRPEQPERRHFWGQPFEDDEEQFDLPDRLRRFFRKEFRFQRDPNEGITIIPNERDYRLDEFEQRLDELESRQEQILDALEKLRKDQ
jgi:hypothetical protein